MRAISRFGRYVVQIRPQVNEAYATGAVKTIVQPLYALFYPTGLLPMERELAMSRFAFNGFYQQEDEVSVIPPDYRIGVFDSRDAQAAAGWSDEDRITVERELTRLSDVYPNDLFVVPELLTPAPWPRYDDYAGDVLHLMAKIVEDGYSPDQVLAYERENQDRLDVVEALEQLIEDGVAEPAAEEVLG